MPKVFCYFQFLKHIINYFRNKKTEAEELLLQVTQLVRNKVFIYREVVGAKPTFPHAIPSNVLIVEV